MTDKDPSYKSKVCRCGNEYLNFRKKSGKWTQYSRCEQCEDKRHVFKVPILVHLFYMRKVQGLMSMLCEYKLTVKDYPRGRFDIVQDDKGRR